MQPIVAEIEPVDQAVSELQASPRCLLRVTVPLSFAVLGPRIASFFEKHPDVRAELVSPARVVDLVKEGFDVAVRPGHWLPEQSCAEDMRRGQVKHVLENWSSP